MVPNICLFIFSIVIVSRSTVTNAFSCDSIKCPSIPKHYDELGCQPIKKNGDCCVSSFDCPDPYGHENSKCYYKNRTLVPGEVLEIQQSDTCEGKCYCNLNRAGGPSEIICSRQRCTQKLPADQKVRRCMKQYDHENCCPVKSVCDDDINKLATCEFEGRVYREGERMYPKYHCYKCICAKNYNSETSVPENENCFKIDCGIALTKTRRLSEGCIPVYIKTDDCCPIGWRCPGEKHLNIDGGYAKDAKEMCRFGSMLLKVGESLDLGGDNCQNCTCSMPPMLHCLQTC